MNQKAILQSNLLEIIFENRNKEYGAYKLRKTYSRRLTIAVSVTAVIALALSLVSLSGKPSVVFKNVHILTLKPGANITRLQWLPKPAAKKMEAHSPVVKSISKRFTDVNRPPLIVAANINILPATPPGIQPSVTGGVVAGMSPAEVGESDPTSTAVNTDVPITGKPIASAAAEIMPQYPGGIRALLSFLKKNIQPPIGAEQGEDVSVKIEFIVNYDGSLDHFNVVKSGGEIFDEEVLRLLKKMPLWIPGKSNGKSVAVYYTVPVKFVSEF